MYVLLDSASNNRPQWSTALVAAELHRYNIDIAALSETRISDEGSLTEVGGGCTFVWKGRPPGSHSRWWFCCPFFSDRIPCWHQWTFDVHGHSLNPGEICHSAQCICSYTRLLEWRKKHFLRCIAFHTPACTSYW